MEPPGVAGMIPISQISTELTDIGVIDVVTFVHGCDWST